MHACQPADHRDVRLADDLAALNRQAFAPVVFHSDGPVSRRDELIVADDEIRCRGLVLVKENMCPVSVRALIVPPAKARIATYVALEKNVARFARMPVFEREFRCRPQVFADALPVRRFRSVEGRLDGRRRQTLGAGRIVRCISDGLAL